MARNEGFDEIQWSGELRPRKFYPSIFKRKWGFKSKKQLLLFMVWEEEWYGGGVVIYARVLFNSLDWIGI